MKRLMACMAVLCLAQPVYALKFALPLACAVGKECYIQNFVDESAGSAYFDYMCRHLTYDKHDGTDFRVKNYAAMRKGVDVLAAAPGKVAAIRDGEQDIDMRENPHFDKERSCGNAVILRHAEGYETYYCHMRQGSVAVKVGDEVRTGDKLGLIGISGMAQFPHLHFGVKHNGLFVDPFTTTPKESGCLEKTPAGNETLWDNTALRELSYKPSAFLNVGVATQVPDMRKAVKGEYIVDSVPTSAKVLFFWVQMMGTDGGDVVNVELRFPDKTIHRQDYTLPRNQAESMVYMGVKAGELPFPRGIYAGEVVLTKKSGFKIRHVKSFTVF